MAIFFEKEVEFNADFPLEEVAKLAIEASADLEGIPYEFDVTITLVDNETMKEINLEQRGIEKTTDVLSFPNLDFPSPADFSCVEENIMCYVDPDTDNLMLGDIVISVPKLQEQAKEYGHSEKREFAFLIVHSMLHLCGYDHMTDQEAKEMEEKQEQVLQEIQISRE